MSLQWLVEKCWDFHTSTALDAATNMVFWLRFAALAFDSVKNLYRKGVVYKSAWQGRQTPGGIAKPRVLEHLHTNKSYRATKA